MPASPNPYDFLEPRAFWRPAVGSRNALEIDQLWRPRFTLSQNDKVITAGSCFAQHIGQALKRNGFKWLDAEPGPKVNSPEESAALKNFGYGVFSFRTGNIYTAALFRQWITWALDPSSQSDEIWENNGRFFDPQRPAIEPGGFASAEECRFARQQVLSAIFRAISEAKFFVFTLGLTEGWTNSETGTSYAMCPGTLAGEFNPSIHKFENYKHSRILSDMSWVIEKVRAVNPDLRWLLTISPVPLTATATDDHVLCATMSSKSTLRSVAEELRQTNNDVDYFPSYEIIASPAFRGMFYAPNQREVSAKGVEHVMAHFFEGLGIRTGKQAPISKNQAVHARPSDASSLNHDIQCEEAVLAAFEK